VIVVQIFALSWSTMQCNPVRVTMLPSTASSRDCVNLPHTHECNDVTGSQSLAVHAVASNPHEALNCMPVYCGMHDACRFLHEFARGCMQLAAGWHHT